MNTFKITNITNFLGKRDAKANSILDIEYIDNMTKKLITIKPNESIYLTIPSLPLSVHRLRVKNLITVAVISETELATMQETLKPKKSSDTKSKTPKKVVEIKTEEEVVEKYSTGKRKTTKKETDEE
jgi:hypothetical protein